MQILKERNHFRPFEYPWAYEIWKEHESLHWLATDVAMHDDVRDWNTKLNEAEKNLLTHLFRFFTQADVDVAAGYNKLFLPYFGHKPELAMMMDSFAAREAVHIDAYALLLETVGMPETSYSQFQDYKEMKDKHDFVSEFDIKNPIDALKCLAVYSGFSEGMQLFASFVVLLNFARFNKMKNMGNIVAWSIRDEDTHVDGMTLLFKEFKNDCIKTYFPTYDSAREFKEKLEYEIREIALKMVELEDSFIDLIYSDSAAIEGLAPEEVKKYIRFVANKRWSQLGFDGVLFDEAIVNPLVWVDHMVNGENHTNFFEAKATFYSKGMVKGSTDDIEW